jgi:hypothetical protein
MNPENIRLMREAYAVIGGLTPLKNADCGKLCDRICCRGDTSGMLLFPGEEDMLTGVPGFYIEEIEYMDTPGIKLLLCDGVCDRDMRPFACRIFPAAPNVDDKGGVSVQADIRGRRMCPIYDLEHVDKDFTEAVGKAFDILSENKETLDLMLLISGEIREIKRFYKFSE